MATLASFLSSPLPFPRRHRARHSLRLIRGATSFFSTPLPRTRICSAPRKIHTPVISSSFDEINWNPDGDNSPKKSVISALIQEIEPLDISLIQKDVPLTTIDAMKRTISGMLGLLPSGQFQVYIEALWEPLSKLLVSSMMTGYTLRNAEYRLFLEKNLDFHEQSTEHQTTEGSQLDVPKILLDSAKKKNFTGESDTPSRFETMPEGIPGDLDLQGLGDIPREAHEYILHLQTRLSSVKKELHEVKRKNTALQMQQFVGEEKNDLLDYLRSLQPEKVAELSEPTSPELQDTIHSVVHGLLATLSPRMQSQPPRSSENTSVGKASADSEDCAELVENTSLHFHPLILLTRDYLARLLFWCMLLGHYLRGLEYRLELAELLSLKAETDVPGGEQAT